MFVGREAELDQIERLLADAQNGRGSALVVRGAAGVGKTTLVEHAVRAADGFRVLHALGVESEAELPFAALHELVYPIVDLLGELPEPQSRAMKAALALEQTEPADRFAVDAATLGLLAAAAAEEPVLCVVDDGHWLDRPSADALVFTARRIEHDPVAIVVIARDPPWAFAAPGLAQLRLDGLTDEEAKALLGGSAPSLAPAVVERLIEATAGNPLALLEFAPRAAESEPTGEPLPVGPAVERAFLERSSGLSPAAQRALLLAAASDSGEPEALWAALDAEGIDEDPLVEAERARLLRRGGRLELAHPLARSALYQAAPPAERRRAHRTLAHATRAPDRRAWHLAAAAEGPDEEVAAALDEAAAAAGGRGGVAAEAAALERAARLTPDPEVRARRLMRAGFAANAAGRIDQAERLLAEAADLTSEPELHAEAVARLAYVLYDRGELDRALELATGEAEHAPPRTFARVLGEVLVHRVDIPGALAAAERAAARVGNDVLQNLDLCQMLAWTLELSGRRDDGLALSHAGASRVDPGSYLAIDFATHFLYLEEYGRAREMLDQIVAHEREAGAVGDLVYALDQWSRLETRTGSLTTAYARCLEAAQLTEPLGTNVGLSATVGWLALLEAMLGRPEGRAHGLQSLEIARHRSDRWNEARARASLGLEALASGDFAGTVEWLEPAAEMLERGGVRNVNVFRVHGDLIEALVRLGRRDQAERQLARLRQDGELIESRWAAAIGARCGGLLAADVDVVEAFEDALELHEYEPSHWERARTHLLYGERLRRLNQRRQAREQLHEALTTFDELGSRPWSDRARAELRASGEHLRRKGPTAHEQLTPQELQVSLAAAEGLTNKEIAARLFLSRKTVEFHLSRAYRKLDVRARGELIKLFAEQAAPAERLPAVR